MIKPLATLLACKELKQRSITISLIDDLLFVRLSILPSLTKYGGMDCGSGFPYE